LNSDAGEDEEDSPAGEDEEDSPAGEDEEDSDAEENVENCIEYSYDMCMVLKCNTHSKLSERYVLPLLYVYHPRTHCGRK